MQRKLLKNSTPIYDKASPESRHRMYNSRFVWKNKRFWIAKEILKKKKGTGRINFPDFIWHYRFIVIKIVWYWHKNKYRPMEQDRNPRDKSTDLLAFYLLIAILNQDFTLEKVKFCGKSDLIFFPCKKECLKHCFSSCFFFSPWR